jgi:hypothetical protein
MFRPFRILVLGALGLLVWAAFFDVPGGTVGATAFDADKVANYEVETWKAAKVHSEFSIFINAVMMIREQQHFTWFRSVQEGYSLARALNVFVDLNGRYERVLPDLEDAAAVEKTAKHMTFDPAVVARAQLNWMVTARMPNLGEEDQVASLMAEEYGLRYHVRPDQVFSAAAPRASAFKMWISTTIDPDYPTIAKLLIESHRALRLDLERARAPRPAIP